MAGSEVSDGDNLVEIEHGLLEMARLGIPGLVTKAAG